MLAFPFLLTVQLLTHRFSLNPARSLGPAIVSGKFSPYCWIYFIGPGAGAALAAGLFRLFKFVDLCSLSYAC